VKRRLRLAVVTSALVGLGLIAHTVALGTISLLGASIAVLLGIGLAIPISRGVIHRVPLVASVFGAEILIHMSLCVTSHTVDHSTVGGFVPSGSMLFWHAVAATVAMLVITFMDSVYTAWTRMLASVIGGMWERPSIEGNTALTAAEGVDSFDGSRLGETEISRGPPSYALCA
jgi:hypothetical protein